MSTFKEQQLASPLKPFELRCPAETTPTPLGTEQRRMGSLLLLLYSGRQLKSLTKELIYTTHALTNPTMATLVEFKLSGHPSSRFKTYITKVPIICM